MSTLGEGIRALSDQRELYIRQSAMTVFGTVPPLSATFHAGQAQQDGAPPAAACPAPSTANARLGGQENSK